MRWYPWLNTLYWQILSCYQESRGHHAVLLHSQKGNGEMSLCYALSRWLMCQNPNGRKSCGACRSCRLMIASNHPDFYQLESEESQQSLGVDTIRMMIDNVRFRSRQGGLKVVLFPCTEQLTEKAANSLLKTLEEPPENTYFLLICHALSRIPLTLRSRCIHWMLPSPSEALGLSWLQRSGRYELIPARTALRLCANAPLAAEALLHSACWKDRLSVCAALKDALTHGDFFALLPVLNKDRDNKPLHWLLSLLADARKFQLESTPEFLINIDKVQLVASMASLWPAAILHMQWCRWLHCLRHWSEISGINRELLLVYHLLKWEKDTMDYHGLL